MQEPALSWRCAWGRCCACAYSSARLPATRGRMRAATWSTLSPVRTIPHPCTLLSKPRPCIPNGDIPGCCDCSGLVCGHVRLADRSLTAPGVFVLEGKAMILLSATT